MKSELSINNSAYNNIPENDKEFYPVCAENIYNLGVSLYNQGRKTEALEAFKKAAENKPNFAELHINMGAAFHDLGKLEEALVSYKKALTINPKYAEVYNNIGILRKDQGNLEEAVENYNRAIEIRHNYSEAYNNLGVVLQNQGKLQEAMKAYHKALSINPNIAQIYNNLGIILNNQGRPKKALEAFNKSIEIEPNYAEAYTNKGITLKKYGQLEEALQAFEIGINIMPENSLLKMNLQTLKNLLVPCWHIEMMNDKSRNDAYFKAIKLAVSKHDIVLDIGTGSGLLSMMAAEAGAKRVITCENSKSISKIADQIISHNGYNDKIKVINKKSTDLIVGTDLPEKADLVISEILSSEFVGEGVQSTILDANNRLKKSNGKMIPEAGDIRIALLGETPEISEIVSVSNVDRFDLTKFNSVIGNKFNIKFKEKPNFLSDTKIAFKINLSGSKKIIEEEKIITFTASKSGFCIGLVQWLSINIYGNIKYENYPGETASHWVTPIYLFDRPVKLEMGEKIQIKASLFTDRIWFCEVL